MRFDRDTSALMALVDEAGCESTRDERRATSLVDARPAAGCGADILVLERIRVVGNIGWKELGLLLMSSGREHASLSDRR